MKKVTLYGHIEVPEADLAQILNELPKHIDLTRAEAGCLVFNVEQDTENKLLFSVYEEFESQAAFEYHQQRVKGSKWGEVSKDVKRYYKIERA